MESRVPGPSGGDEVRQGLRTVRVCARRQLRLARRLLKPRGQRGPMVAAVLAARDLLIMIYARIMALVTDGLSPKGSRPSKTHHRAPHKRERRVGGLEAGDTSAAPTQEEIRSGQRVTTADPQLARQVSQGLAAERAIIRNRKKREP